MIADADSSSSPNPVDGLPILPPLEESNIRTQVFTHRSYYARPTASFEDPQDNPSPDNEQLEHLGDSVLNLCVTLLIRQKYPYLRVGPATKIRSLIVTNPNLASIATYYSLCDHLKTSPSQTLTLRNSINVQADTFEAYIGGLYVENGLEVVQTWLSDLFSPYAEEAYRKIRAEYGLDNNNTSIPEQDQDNASINTSMELGQLSYFNQSMSQLKKTDIEWKWQLSEESKTTPIWLVDLYVDGKLCGSGRGSKKKLAQNEAARQALIRLGLAKADGARLVDPIIV